MKILFLTLARIENIENQGIYPDLLRKFRDNGHEVTIVTPSERKYGSATKYFSKNGVNILKVWTTNIQKTNLIEKGITTIFIEFYFFFAIRKFLLYKNFDLILYTTPPITFTSLIKKIKKSSNAKTYLLLKDIFPQNAVDLNLIRYNSLLYKYFRRKEKVLYKISDFIGCMSQANLKYILNHNPEINPNNIEINPNSIEVRTNESISKSNITLFSKYKIPLNKTIFLFGGNLGIPQGVDFLKINIIKCNSIKDAFFLIIGNGTEIEKINNWIKNYNIKNALLINELPSDEFEEITKCVNVGLIFLNPQFTIPNFPSRLLNYMQHKLPVICATDLNTDIGKIASENGFGFTCLTNDYHSFYDFVVKLLNKKLQDEMGKRAFEYLKQEYSVDRSYLKIIEKFN
jgi:glycosyltransferase involved in cell wall biosynthesis